MRELRHTCRSDRRPGNQACSDHVHAFLDFPISSVTVYI